MRGASISDDQEGATQASGGWRTLAAFIIAPLLPSGLVGSQLLGSSAGFGDWVFVSFLVAAFGAYPIVLTVGLFAYAIVVSKFRRTLLASCVTGAITAGVPWLLLSLVSQVALTSSKIGDRIMVDDHRVTIWGFLQSLMLGGVAAGLGAIAGLAFYLIAFWRPGRERPS